MLPTALIHIEHLPLIRVRFTAASLRQVPFFYVPSLGRQGPDETPPADTGFLLELYPLLSPMVREEKEVIVTKGDRIMPPGRRSRVGWAGEDSRT